MENRIDPNNDSAEVQYIDNYLDCVENLPNDLQRQLSRILDLDVTNQKFLREFEKQQKIVTNPNVDKTIRTQTLLQMQDSLISLQNIGDEKLQLVQIIQNLVEKKVDLLNTQKKNIFISEQENNEPINKSNNNLNSSEKSTKLNLRGRKSKLNLSEKVLDTTDTSILSENQSNISSSSTGASKKISITNTNRRTKRKAHTNPKYEDNNQSSDEPEEPIYCICRQISFGKMIMCDNDLCVLEWFHFKCVSLTKKPKGKWYCPRCRGHRPNIMKSKTEQR